MKIKKLIPLVACIMGLSALGGCTNADQKIIFSSLWYSHTNSDSEPIHETLHYDVTFKAAESTSFVNYKLNYKDGRYTTTLVSEGAGENLVYTYTTNLSIVAQYTLGETSIEKTDTVVSEVKFKAVNFGLQPISSQKEIQSHTPNGTHVNTIEDCYQQFHYTVSTTYQNGCAEGKSVVTNLLNENGPDAKEQSFEINQKKYTYLDNEQLLAALRCIRNSTTSAKVNVYSPFVNAIQTVSLGFAADASEEFTLKKDGVDVKDTITYRPVSLQLDEQNPGATQTAWIAKGEDINGVNKYRNVMLYLKAPLAYGLGDLEYTLVSMDYQA